MNNRDFGVGLDFDDESKTVDQIVASAANRMESGLSIRESVEDRARSILGRLGAHNVDDAMKLLDIDAAELGDVIGRFRTEHPHFFRSRSTSSGREGDTAEDLADAVAHDLSAGILPMRARR